MYRLIKYEGKDGTDKLKNIAAIHSLDGSFYWTVGVGSVIGFEYDDDSGKMLRSSIIEDIVTENNIIKITTMNSVFWFKEIEE